MDIHDREAARQPWAVEASNIEPSDMTQGIDGTPALYYFDHPRLLAFLWSGNYNAPIEVSFGGFGEPVVWKFNFYDHRPSSAGIAGTYGLTTAFALVCQDWMLAKEDAR